MTTYSPLKNQALEKKLHENREAIEKHNQTNDFTPEERVLISEGFKEITGHEMPSNCTKCYPQQIKILRNWFNLYDHRVIEPVKKPLKKVMVLKKELNEDITGESAFEEKLPVYEVVGVEDLSITLTEDPEVKFVTISEKREELKKDNFKPKTVKDYKEALKHMGVKIPHNATKPQLKALWDENN